MEEPKYVKASAYARSKCLSLEETIKKCEANEIIGAFQKDGQWFVPMGAVFPKTNVKTRAVKAKTNVETRPVKAKTVSYKTTKIDYPSPKNTASIVMLILTLLLFLFWMCPAVTTQFGNNDPVVTSCYEGIFGNEYISQNPTLITCFIFTILSVITILFSIYCRNYSFRKIWYACTTVFLIFNFPTVLSTFISQSTTANLSNSDVTITVGFGIIATVIIQFICLVVSLYLLSSKEEDK